MSNFRQFGFARIRIPIDSLNGLGCQGRQKVVRCDRAIVPDTCVRTRWEMLWLLYCPEEHEKLWWSLCITNICTVRCCSTSLRPTKPFPKTFEGSAHERIWNPFFSEFLFSCLSADVRTTWIVKNAGRLCERQMIFLLWSFECLKLLFHHLAQW